MHRTVRLITAALVAVVLLGAPLARQEPADAAAEIRLSSSPSTAGTSAARLVSPRVLGTVAWRSSGRAAGAWVQATFARRTMVDASVLSGAGRSLRIEEGRLQFSDGSVIAVHTDSRGSRRVVFVPRAVRWVRLTVTRVAAGQRAVGLTRWTVRRSAAHLESRQKGDAGERASVSASSGHPIGTRWLASRSGPGQWIRLAWPRPVELSAVQITGGATSSERSIRSGRLEFSDGSAIGVGTLERRGGAPTTIAFTPRSVSSVRFRVISIPGGAAAAVRKLSAYTVGFLPPMPRVPSPTFRASAGWGQPCSGVRASGPSSILILLCPSNGMGVTSVARLVLAGPAETSLAVEAYRPRGSGGSTVVVQRGRFDSHGTARLSISTRRLLHGPTAVRVTTRSTKAPLYIQFVNASGVTQVAPRSNAARGLDLKYDEQFTQPLSVTRSGAAARYASGKPNGYGVDDFGDAIFAQPTRADGNLATVDGYLRIRSQALAPGQVDPAGYGRRAVGGMVSSGHMGGSGFSAQYGYFEARMLGPAGAGTWPAFWLLSTGSLYQQRSSTAEVDAVELYGSDTRSACQTTHDWLYAGAPLVKAFCGPLPDGGDWALTWHTYGARVTPTGTDFYVDGKRTGHAPAAVGSSEPFFFLVDLALGGGWPVDLSGTNSRADLYVDSVRVWV